MNELAFFDSLFNDLLGDATPHAVHNYSTPRVDVKENDNNYTLEMELPGRSEKDVNIELDHDNLTISSKEETAEEKKDKKEKYILKERRYSSFERRFTLPADVDSEGITANFKNGVLTINMTKKAIAAPKKIAIEAC